MNLKLKANKTHKIIKQKKGISLSNITYLPICLHVFIAILLLGCSNRINKGDHEEVKKNLFMIDVEANIDKIQVIPLSKVANEINYIPLETREDNLISNMRQIKITESYIFISGKSKLLQFTRDGKFVRQIGNLGRGPGEYSSVMYFDVNEKNDIILLRGEYKNNKYNISGDFKGEVNLPGSLFSFFGSNRIAFYLPNHISKPNNLVITNQYQTPLFTFQNQNPRPKTRLRFGDVPLYVFENKLYFKENFNDTVFCVKDSILIPHFIINEKNLLFDIDFDLKSTGKVADMMNQLEKVKNKLMTKNIFESQRFVLITYKMGEGPKAKSYIRVLFDKIYYDTYVTDKMGFINDLNGGDTFWPTIIFQDSIMVGSQEAFEFKDYVRSEAFKNSTPKYPEKKKELERLANSLDENDNPVLMLVKLKE